MRKRTLPVAMLALALAVPVGVARAEEPSTVNPLPQGYAADEFPDWAVRLRRFEIITLGAFPIALFYTRFVFDIGRWTVNGIQNDWTFSAAYAPWPFKGELYQAPGTWGRLGIFLGATALSLGIGGLDYWLLERKNGAP